MLEFSNIEVYDLKQTVIASGNAMRLQPVEYTDEEFERGIKRMVRLCKASQAGNIRCHDNALTGIRVSFDMKYTQYITKQFQRYHFFDYVSSSSLMHRITKMDFTKCCNKYVDDRVIAIMQELISDYNIGKEKSVKEVIEEPIKESIEEPELIQEVEEIQES